MVTSVKRLRVLSFTNSRNRVPHHVPHGVFSSLARHGHVQRHVRQQPPHRARPCLWVGILLRRPRSVQRGRSQRVHGGLIRVIRGEPNFVNRVGTQRERIDGAVHEPAFVLTIVHSCVGTLGTLRG